MNDLSKGLYGENAHVSTLTIFDELDMDNASKAIANQHSIWQILNHMIYWQGYILRLLREENTVPPKHASETWFSEIKPPNKKGWELGVNKFKDGLLEAIRFAEEEHEGSNNQMEHLLSLISHNSYHSGQVVFIRRYLNHWPPPTGGDTW